VTDIIVRNPFDVSQAHRQHWLGALQGLNLALLIDIQHQGVIRWIQTPSRVAISQ